MKHNVYDFDKTIYDGDSSQDFYRYCVKMKPGILLLLPSFIWTTALYFLKFRTLTELKESFFSFLIKLDVTDELLSAFWETNMGKIKAFYLRNKGPSDIIISASPEFLLTKPCEILGVEHLIGSMVDKSTGKFMGVNCKGEEKVRRLNEAYKGVEIGEFYSDSLSDLPLAEMAEKAFLIKGEDVEKWPFENKSFTQRAKDNFLTRDFLLFVFCGGMGTLINFLMSLLFSTKVDPVFSYALAYGLSLFVTYALNAKLIFDSGLEVKGFIKFTISYLPNFAILFSFVYMFINVFSWNKIIVYALAGLLGLPITFMFVKIYAFGRKDK